MCVCYIYLYYYDFVHQILSKNVTMFLFLFVCLQATDSSSPRKIIYSLCQYIENSGEKVCFHWSVLLTLTILRGITFLNSELPENTIKSFCGTFVSPSDFPLSFVLLFFHTGFYLYFCPPQTDTYWLAQIYLISQSFIINYKLIPAWQQTSYTINTPVAY